MADDLIFDSDDLLKLLRDYELSKGELRRALRPAARYLFNKMQSAVGRGWGVRTGRLSREGIKMGVSSRDEKRGGAAYRIYFSKKSGLRGTPEYMADTFKARWLEGGTKPHYTASGYSSRRKKTRLRLNSETRKLRHPGFRGRPVVEDTVFREFNSVIAIVRADIYKNLKKKGADTSGNS